jgi:adenylate kinase
VFFAYFYVAITFNPNEVADNMKKYKVVARLLKRSEIDGPSDDNEETVRVRLQVYAEQTEPLLKVYRSRGLLVDVDGLGEIEEVSERVFAALEAHREGKASELIEP